MRQAVSIDAVRIGMRRLRAQQQMSRKQREVDEGVLYRQGSGLCLTLHAA